VLEEIRQGLGVFLLQPGVIVRAGFSFGRCEMCMSLKKIRLFRSVIGFLLSCFIHGQVSRLMQAHWTVECFLTGRQRIVAMQKGGRQGR